MTKLPWHDSDARKRIRATAHIRHEGKQAEHNLSPEKQSEKMPKGGHQIPYVEKDRTLQDSHITKDTQVSWGISQDECVEQLDSNKRQTRADEDPQGKTRGQCTLYPVPLDARH